MAAYIIARVKVTDPDRYPDYTAQTPGIIAANGGRFIVRGGRCETREGPQEDRRIVVIEFDSFEQAQACYDSPEYQAIVGIRWEAAESEMVIVEGP